MAISSALTGTEILKKTDRKGNESLKPSNKNYDPIVV